MCVLCSLGPASTEPTQHLAVWYVQVNRHFRTMRNGVQPLALMKTTLCRNEAIRRRVACIPWYTSREKTSVSELFQVLHWGILDPRAPEPIDVGQNFGK